MFTDSRVYSLILLLAALFVALGVQGNETAPTETRAEAEEWPDGLKERVLNYWQAKIDGRAESAYGYVSPAMRESLSYKHFLRQMKGVGRWKAVDPLRAECQGMRCDVTLNVEIRMRLPQFPAEIHTVGPVTERWFRKDGEWWILPDD